MKNFNDLQKHIERAVQEQNNRGIVEFEGYSPNEMQQILYATFDADSPLKLLKLTDDDYGNIPFLNQIKYFLHQIDAVGELKLTTNGYLPPKIVLALYHQGFLKEELIEHGITKLRKEADTLTVRLTRIIANIAGLVKKRNSKLSLTAKAEKVLSDDQVLFNLIFTAFTTRFNWAYFDRYGEENIGRLGFGFTLILLSKYGDKPRMSSFYAERYFKAFPDLLSTIRPWYGTVEEYATACFSLRTFERFLDYFGLIEIRRQSKWLESDISLSKTALFNRLIRCTPPQNARN